MHNWLKYTALATVVGLAACTSSPTGRNQLLLFSDQDMSALGAQSFEQMKQQQKISKDKKINAYVQCVAKAVTQQVPQQPEFKDWEVVVFDLSLIHI